MSEQKALVIPSATSTYTLISKPIPVPGPDEVLVKVEAIGLNPSEWKMAMRPHIFEPFGFPLYTGIDGTGVVEVVGQHVKEPKKGDRIIFQGWFIPNYSAYQQYALALSSMVVKIPSDMSNSEAASVPAALRTAALAFCLPDPAVTSFSPIVGDLDFPLLTQGRAGAGIKPFWEEGAKGLKQDEPLVVIGGSSSVGQLAIQIAAHYGFSPIIATSSVKHAEYLKTLGATHNVDRNASDAIEIVKAILRRHPKPLNYIFASVEALTQAYVDLLAPRGTVMTAVPIPPEIQFTEGKRQVLTSGAGHAWCDYVYGLSGALEGLLASGVIKPITVEKIPGGLAGIPAGLERLKKGQVSGVKLVVDAAETA